MDIILQIFCMVIYYIFLYNLYLFFKKIKLDLFSFIVLNTITVFIICLFFYIVDVFRIPKWIYDTKIQKDTCMDVSMYHTIFMKSIFKYIFIYIPFTILLFSIVNYRNRHYPGLSLLKITFFVFCVLYASTSFCSEVVSYLIHRYILHSEQFFQYHKEHHEYIAPICPSIFDGHPIESFFWNLLPTFSFAILFGLPIHILYVSAFLGSVVALLAHCGYRFVDYGIMDTAHHDLHHERMKCNYSTPFVDYVMGTYIYREPDKVYPKFDKIEKDLSVSVNTPCN